MSIFAKRLKLAMDRAGMKQVELAEQAGIPRSAVSQYLSGKNIPTKKRMQILAQITDVSIDFLAGTMPAPEEKIPVPAKKISTAEAARCLGKSNQFVRVGLQRGLLPFGNAVPGTRERFNYYISPIRFRDYVGAERFNEFFGITQ